MQKFLEFAHFLCYILHVAFGQGVYCCSGRGISGQWINPLLCLGDDRNEEFHQSPYCPQSLYLCMTYSSLKSSLSFISLVSLDDVQDQTGLQKRDILLIIMAREPNIPLFSASVRGRDKIYMRVEDAQMFIDQNRKDHGTDNGDTDQRNPRDREHLSVNSTSATISGAI